MAVSNILRRKVPKRVANNSAWPQHAMSISIIDLQQKISIPSSKIKSITRKSAVKLKLTHDELSIVCVGIRRMRSLNKKHLGHDYVTDVITFDHGEIVICPLVAAQNAKRYGTSVEREILMYVIHGLLHLAGYDDHCPQDIALMRKMEVKLLGGL